MNVRRVGYRTPDASRLLAWKYLHVVIITTGPWSLVPNSRSDGQLVALAAIEGDAST